MSTDNKPRRNVQTGSLAGMIWTIGWMFTIAYANLLWWQTLLAILIWPYFLGLAVR